MYCDHCIRIQIEHDFVVFIRADSQQFHFLNDPFHACCRPNDNVKVLWREKSGYENVNLQFFRELTS